MLNFLFVCLFGGGKSSSSFVLGEENPCHFCFGGEKYFLGFCFGGRKFLMILCWGQKSSLFFVFGGGKSLICFRGGISLGVCGVFLVFFLEENA